MDDQKNWHDEHVEGLSLTDRLADMISTYAGSWSFVLLHAVWFFVWIYCDIEVFPYGLLTMIVSLEAIFLSSFILISQNRQAARDRIQAQADYDTNLEAKREIEQLQIKLSRIETDKLDKIIRLIEREK